MGFMDKAKVALNQAKDKAADLADQHGDKIDQGIGKAGDFVDKKTGGKHASKIDQAQARARQAADRLAAERRETGAFGAEPPVPDSSAGTTLRGDLVNDGPTHGDAVLSDPTFPAPAYPDPASADPGHPAAADPVDPTHRPPTY